MRKQGTSYSSAEKDDKIKRRKQKDILKNKSKWNQINGRMTSHIKGKLLVQMLWLIWEIKAAGGLRTAENNNYPLACRHHSQAWLPLRCTFNTSAFPTPRPHKEIKPLEYSISNNKSVLVWGVLLERSGSKQSICHQLSQYQGIYQRGAGGGGF